MKTAVTVLQEMMVKMSQVPDYDCISQSGPEHQAMFEYRCAALGMVVTAQARSKKEAKQEAARLMLRALASRGHSVPAPYGLHDLAPDGSGASTTSGGPAVEAGDAGGSATTTSAVGTRSYVALLQELVVEYRLPSAEYLLVGDTGPPHLRHFTIEARVGHRTAQATATTKKAARQKAAEQLYTYLRENLARLTSDFVEEEALVRAHERAMERYLETREDTRRPNLGQKIADYHLEAEKCSESLRQLELGGSEELERMLRVLGLSATEIVLPSSPRVGAGARPGGGVHVLRVEAQPPLAFAGPRLEDAQTAALRYLRRALQQQPPTIACPPTG